MWEAAMAAGHFGLDNLTVIVDRNGLQQGDFTERTMRLEPLADKWRAFGWHVAEVDGHDHHALRRELAVPAGSRGRPSVVICHTTKGKGISFMENTVLWHYRTPQGDEYTAACAELDALANETTHA